MDYETDRSEEILIPELDFTEPPTGSDRRTFMPNGGLKMVLNSLEAYGYKPDPQVVETFTKYRKTHNEGVFDVYTAEVRKARSSHVLTGLPDAYGRGRIIGDYRRVALYGVDRLIERKKEEKAALDSQPSTDDIIRDREELADQIRALGDLKEMAAKYGFDISRPAESAREAVQWLYFGYLGAVKDQNGAAMSLSSPKARICSDSSSRSRMISSVDHSASSEAFSAFFTWTSRSTPYSATRR